MFKKAKSKEKYSLTLTKVILLISAFIILTFFVITAHYDITPDGLSPGGQVMIGILIMAAFLWITEPIPLAVTGLLVMILQPLLHIRESSAVFSSFGNQAIFFLIGAFIIAAAIEKHGLHKRIALKFLSLFGENPRFFTFGIMCACAFLSFVMPEHGVAALFLPIIASILISMKIVPRQSNFGKVSMLAVAYGCSIGSLGTLVGGARNPYTVEFLATQGIHISFFDWMKYSMPVVFIALPLVWIVLNFSFPLKIKDIIPAKNEIQKQVEETGKMSKQELKVLGILILTIFLWIFATSEKYYSLAVIAVLGGVLLFITGTINWKDVEQRVPWGIILLYGGAITLGLGIQDQQAGEWIANGIFNMASDNLLIVIFAMILFTVLLTNIMSNMAAVAILLPIGFSVALKVDGLGPELASMIVALSGGLAFMFVISTPGNAITYSSGYFSTKDLLRAGVVANLICIVILFAVAIIYWKGVLGL